MYSTGLRAVLEDGSILKVLCDASKADRKALGMEGENAGRYNTCELEVPYVRVRVNNLRAASLALFLSLASHERMRIHVRALLTAC